MLKISCRVSRNFCSHAPENRKNDCMQYADVYRRSWDKVSDELKLATCPAYAAAACGYM